MAEYIVGIADDSVQDFDHLHREYAVNGTIVRCKDCEHRFDGGCYNKKSDRVNFTVYVPDDWFCADGERR